jgi:hypothetical protein
LIVVLASDWLFYNPSVTFYHPRVTRLGEFSPFGWLFTLAIFYYSSRPYNCGTVFNGKSDVLILMKTDWATFWATFFKNASGHPSHHRIHTPRINLRWAFFAPKSIPANRFKIVTKILDMGYFQRACLPACHIAVPRMEVGSRKHPISSGKLVKTCKNL